MRFNRLWYILQAEYEVQDHEQQNDEISSICSDVTKSLSELDDQFSESE